MAETATPPTEPPAPEDIDPFAKTLLESLGKVLPPTPETNPDDIPLRPTVTLGEAVTAIKSGSKEPGVTPPAPPAKTKEQLDAEAAKAAADAKAAEDAAKLAQPPPKPPVVKRKLPQPPPEPPPVPPAPAAPPADDLDKDLDEDQKEEIELAKYAEKRGKKGIVDATRKYISVVEEFISKNPDADPDGEEFTELVKNNKPKWTDAERKRFERGMIAERAAEEARRALDPVIRQQSEELERIRSAPLIDGAADTVADIVTTPVDDPELKPVKKDVVSLIKTEGFEKASEKFPIEAPVISGAMEAAKSYMRLRRNVEKLDPNNQTHSWLIQFLFEEGQNMKRQPKEVQTLADGRTFLPMHEFLAETEKDPKARSKFWTFSDQAVVDMIGNRAILTINKEKKKLAAAGYILKDDTVPADSGKSTPPATPETGGSPRAGGTSIPGASDSAEPTGEDEAAAFVNSLIRR